ncbi:hypothetical protein BDW60DRAFT_172434 [Aspergillus nidulans var. acristatus]
MLVKPRYGPLLTACSLFRPLLSAYCCLPLVRSSPSRHPSLLWYTIGCVPPGKYAKRAKKPRVEYTPGNAYTTTSPFSPKLGERSGGKAQIEKEAMKKRKR